MIHFENNPTPLLPWRVENRDSYEQDITTFHWIREVNPIHNISIRFNEFSVTSVRLPLQEQSLEVVGDPAVVVVPKVDLHEVFLIGLRD